MFQDYAPDALDVQITELLVATRKASPPRTSSA